MSKRQRIHDPTGQVCSACGAPAAVRRTGRWLCRVCAARLAQRYLEIATANRTRRRRAAESPFPAEQPV